MLRQSLVWLVFLGAATPGWAAWADSMFDELSRDFGSVPHGHVASHPFRIVNRTGSTVHISNVRVSCGCTTAHALQTTLAPGEDTAVVVQMDTRRFFNARTVSIYVQFDQPRFDEVRLWVQANSRDDVAVIPETLTFGHIKTGSSPSATVAVSFLGDSSWQITTARCDSNYIQIGYKETRRDDSEVVYQLTAHVRPDTPAGKWYTDVWLATSNAGMPRLRVPLTVEIEPKAQPKPQPKAAPVPPKPRTAGHSVSLGKVNAGVETERKIIIRGTQPFKVTAITGTDDEVRVRDSNSESRSVHVMLVTVRAVKAGTLARTIRIRTDLPRQAEFEFDARAEVSP